MLICNYLRDVLAKGFQLRFETSPGGVQLSRIFAGLDKIPRDMKVPLQEVSDEFYESQKKTFDVQGGFEGKPRWKALQREYAARKAREFPGKPILVRLGSFRDSLTSPTGTRAIHKLGKKELIVGTDLPVEGGFNLGVLHQEGTETMQARKVILFSKNQRERWVRIFRDWLGDRIDASVSQQRQFAPKTL